MATATIPKPSPPSASELAARILDLALELAVAHRANNQRAIRCATTLLVDACHGLAPGSLGPPQLVAPVEALRRDVNADGLAYELQSLALEGKPHLMLKLLDVTGDDALAHLDLGEARRLLVDLAAVLAYVEGGRG